MSTKLLINILIVLLVGAGAFVAYSYFMGGDEEVTSGVQVVGGNSATIASAGEASEFVILLDSLKTVDLKSTIFSNQAFAVDLQDFTTPLPARPRGRSNPFAALGSGNLTPTR